MIASAQAFRNGSRWASGEWVCLRIEDEVVGCAVRTFAQDGAHGAPYEMGRA
jgi:hypothetical protein